MKDFPTVPTSGYNSDIIPATAGYVYAIRTAQGNYAKVRIDSISGDNVIFSWEYRSDGGTIFWK